MIRVPRAFPATWNLADLLEHLGGISPQRIRLRPAPGKARELHVIEIHDREDRLYELVEGVLVEKIMGFSESCLAIELGRLLGNFIAEHDLGILAGADGALRLMQGLVRIPDLAFVSWEHLPERRFPDEALPDLTPDLAVEILSEGNTPGEMDRKLRDYFFCGTRLVWYIDPQRRTVRVYTSPDRGVELSERQTLDGGAVLPGFSLPLAQLFARLPPQSKVRRKRKKNG
ncbi:MAG TPA: Uma2 family endonuclease [Gemmataceae bacterium]|nr:Uma2 family endonuclease [Gemmataceae bacterium]